MYYVVQHSNRNGNDDWVAIGYGAPNIIEKKEDIKKQKERVPSFSK